MVIGGTATTGGTLDLSYRGTLGLHLIQPFVRGIFSSPPKYPKATRMRPDSPLRWQNGQEVRFVQEYPIDETDEQDEDHGEKPACYQDRLRALPKARPELEKGDRVVALAPFETDMKTRKLDVFAGDTGEVIEVLTSKSARILSDK